jgi:hypothetical protein
MLFIPINNFYSQSFWKIIALRQIKCTVLVLPRKISISTGSPVALYAGSFVLCAVDIQFAVSEPAIFLSNRLLLFNPNFFPAVWPVQFCKKGFAR